MAHHQKTPRLSWPTQNPVSPCGCTSWRQCYGKPSGYLYGKTDCQRSDGHSKCHPSCRWGWHNYFDLWHWRPLCARLYPNHGAGCPKGVKRHPARSIPPPGNASFVVFRWANQRQPDEPIYQRCGHRFRRLE